MGVENWVGDGVIKIYFIFFANIYIYIYVFITQHEQGKAKSELFEGGTTSNYNKT